MAPVNPNPEVPVTGVKDDPKKPLKAYVTVASTAVGAFVMAWVLDTDPFTLKEAGAAALGALGFAGVGGFATYRVKNPKVRA